MPLMLVQSSNVSLGQTFVATLRDDNRRLPVRIKRINAQTLIELAGLGVRCQGP